VSYLIDIDIIDFFKDNEEYSEYKMKKYDLIVLFDIFRATSTITALKQQGIEEIYISDSVGKLLEIKSEKPEVFICGERNGIPPEGFDSGNSPKDILSTDINSRTAYITTTNGTRSLKAFQNNSNKFLAVSLFNIDKSANYINDNFTDGNLLFICAGTENNFSIEDYAAASILVNCIYRFNNLNMTDKLRACNRLGNLYISNTELLVEDLSSAFHAKRLEKIGKKNDVDFILSNINSLNALGEISIL